MADYEKAKQAAAKKAKEDDAATKKDIESKTDKEQSDLLKMYQKGLKPEKGDPGMKKIDEAMKGVKAKKLEDEPMKVKTSKSDK